MKNRQILHKIIIKPLTGIEGLSLGISKSDVIKILGEPDHRSTENLIDDSPDELWDYFKLGLELSFYSDHNALLGNITIESPHAELAGYHLIGLDEKELLETLKKAGIEPIVLEDDFEELGSRYYVCDRLGLSFWVQDGKVDSITIFPEYDESNEIPMWP